LCGCVYVVICLQAKQMERERTQKWWKMIKHWNKYWPGDKVKERGNMGGGRGDKVCYTVYVCGGRRSFHR